jgi:signal transduction histidine kinase
MTDQRRRLLEDMILAELGRHERLMAETTGRPPEHRTIDLDDTIRTLVLSQEARGHTVRWKPSGHRVTGQPDAIAEVINILLDNAARHGNATAEVDVRRTADAVEIVVRDDGPGVDESVRKRLFTWEARGPGSRGQGIGLHTAHELMKRQGGYLALRDGARGGATFVLGLPLDHGGGGARQGSS